jgi:hypothetical protein
VLDFFAAVVRFDDALPVEDFLAVDFLAEDFLAEDFLAVDFLAEDFLAVDFFGADFFDADLAVDFLDVDFLPLDVERFGDRPPAFATFSFTVSAASSALSTAISSSLSTTAPTTPCAVSVASTFLPARLLAAAICVGPGIGVLLCDLSDSFQAAYPTVPTLKRHDGA